MPLNDSVTDKALGDSGPALWAVVAALEGEAGREPTDEELRALGIDPADNTPGRGDLPDVLK